MLQSRAGPSTLGYSPDMTIPFPSLHPNQSGLIQPGLANMSSSSDAIRRSINSQLMAMTAGFKETTPQVDFNLSIANIYSGFVLSYDGLWFIFFIVLMYSPFWPLDHEFFQMRRTSLAGSVIAPLTTYYLIISGKPSKNAHLTGNINWVFISSFSSC